MGGGTPRSSMLFIYLVTSLYKNCTGLDEKTIRKVLLPSQDIWLTAEEAVKYGIADSIKETF